MGVTMITVTLKSDLFFSEFLEFFIICNVAFPSTICENLPITVVEFIVSLYVSVVCSVRFGTVFVIHYIQHESFKQHVAISKIAFMMNSSAESATRVWMVHWWVKAYSSFRHPRSICMNISKRAHLKL